LPKPKKSTKTNKVSSFKNKLIKGKEEVIEADPTANIMEDESNENESKNSVDFLKTIVVNFEPKNSKSLVNCCWYLDLGATKHVSGNKSSFKGLKNFTKAQNLKPIGGQIHGVYGKGNVKLSTFGKIKIIINVFYIP